MPTLFARLPSKARLVALWMLPLLGASYATATGVAQFAGTLSPWHPAAPIEISTDLLALVAFAWTSIQLVQHWRGDGAARRAWALSSVGALLILVGETDGEFARLTATPFLDDLIEIALWSAAAVMLFRCVRLYAWRRFVMAAAYCGLAIQFASQAASLLQYALEGLGGGSLALEFVSDGAELVSLLCYISALVLTQLSFAKSYRLPFDRIGEKARRVAYDFRLQGTPRYPTSIRFLHWPAFSHAVAFALVVHFWRRMSSRVAEASGRSRAAQLLDLLYLAFAKGIDAKTYYLLELYEAGGLQRSRGCLTRAETKNGLTTAINRRTPGGEPSEMNDKLAFRDACAAHGLPSVPILGVACAGKINSLAAGEALDRDLFVKRRESRGAKETMSFRRVGPFAYISGDGRPVGLAEILDICREISHEHDLLIQPKLANAASIARFAEDSLIAFRVTTFVDERGRPQVSHALLRILSKLEPAWNTKPDSEYGAAIDLGTGTLGPLTGDKAYSCTVWRDRHPVTGAAVEGVRIDAWPAIRDLALTAQSVFRARPFVGWDLALTDDGPCLLEGNTNADVAFMQRCCRQPIGASALARFLDGRLDMLAEARIAEAGGASTAVSNRS